ncbi:MAG: hypothetical protein II877_06050 [Synergistaceae bacterium]|nr:hypothetical protein [Synergistaceae bacterium]MBQ6971824.1 hypothetical protein [Synergistaceae bacterium]
MILTDKGRDLLAKALTGKQLSFSRVIVGTGDLGTRRPQELTDLVSRKLALTITALRTSLVGTAEITAEVSNQSITSGFFMKETGIFAFDPDTHAEVLYAYVNKGNEAEYIAGFDGTNPISYVFHFVTVIDMAQNVTAVITEDKSYITPTILDQRIESLFAPSSSPQGFWTYAPNDTRRFRPLTVPETRKAIIGLTDINSLIERVKSLEDAVNQLTLALNVQEIFPQADRFMAEDFLVPDTVDTFTAQVTSIVAGDDSVDCEPIDGLLPGSLYTVTDGLMHEDVKVESVNLENGVMRVIMEDRIRNTYSLNNCRLLRTTADVQDGTAYGTASRRNAVWIPGTEWKGLAASSSFNVSLDTSISRQDCYTFTGAAAINSDGAVTLRRD